MRDTQIISSRINAITTRTIIKSVNIFPPYVIMICSAICHIALMLLYHKEKKNEYSKNYFIFYYNFIYNLYIY